MIPGLSTQMYIEVFKKKVSAIWRDKIRNWKMLQDPRDKEIELLKDFQEFLSSEHGPEWYDEQVNKFETYNERIILQSELENK